MFQLGLNSGSKIREPSVSEEVAIWFLQFFSTATQARTFLGLINRGAKMKGMGDYAKAKHLVC